MRESHRALVDGAMPLGPLGAPDLRKAAREYPANDELGVARPLDVLDRVHAREEVQHSQRLRVEHSETVRRRHCEIERVRRRSHTLCREDGRQCLERGAVLLHGNARQLAVVRQVL